MNPLCWAAALAVFAFSTPAFARPFTIDDFLRLESPGISVVDPTGRWLIHDTQSAYADATRFDLDTNMRPLHSHLLTADLHHPARAIAAFEQNPRGGYVPGPFSPDGRFVTIYRNLDRRWDLGVLNIAKRQVRWLGFGVEFTDRGDTVLWRSATHLVALRMPPGDRYWKERAQQSAMQELPALWAKQNSGAAATGIAIGSGRYIGVHVPDPMRQVVDVDVTTGHVQAYATGVFDSLALSGSGRRVALIEITGRNRLSGSHLLDVGTQFRRAALGVLNLDTGALSKPCPLEPLFSSLRWSPMSEDLLIFARPVGDDDWARGAYRRIGPEGACQTLPMGDLEAATSLEDGGGFTRSHGEWLAGDPIVLATPPSGSRPDWYRVGAGEPVNLTASLTKAPTDPILISDDHSLFLEGGVAISVNSLGVAQKEAAVGITRVHTPLRSNNSALAPEDGVPRLAELFATADSDTTTTLWRLTSTTASEILRIPNQHRTYQAATDKGLVTLKTDLRGESTLELHAAQGQSVVLADANKQLAGVDIPVPIAINHTGPGGEPLKSWLYLPTSHAGRKPPVIVMAYPGVVYATPPHCASPGLCPFVTDTPFLAVGHGYAVLIPSLPTSTGTTAPSRTWGKEIENILDALDKTGLVDTSRAGYWGHSYGGYAGLTLATETNRFKAIIAAAPIADMTSVRVASSAAWLTPYEAEAIGAFAGWSEVGQGHLMGTPWNARERYVEASPIYAADRIQTPLLLVQGDQDVLPIDQSREMFSALYRLGKDALFITFYGEGHSIVSPPNIRAYVKAAFSFLDSYLAPGDGKPRHLDTGRP